jgi:Holliday junction resolvase RusA-like endonuclease
VTFTVYGVAQPKGNMRAFLKRGMKFPIVTETNRNVRSWSQLVAEGASDALIRTGGAQLTGSVSVSCCFALPRPKKYQRRGVEPAHCVAPDLDKLVRGVLDALSQVVFVDDAQVVSLSAVKFYAAIDTAPYAQIQVEPMPTIIPLSAHDRAFVADRLGLPFGDGEEDS